MAHAMAKTLRRQAKILQVCVCEKRFQVKVCYQFRSLNGLLECGDRGVRRICSLQTAESCQCLCLAGPCTSATALINKGHLGPTCVSAQQHTCIRNHLSCRSPCEAV